MVVRLNAGKKGNYKRYKLCRHHRRAETSCIRDRKALYEAKAEYEITGHPHRPILTSASSTSLVGLVRMHLDT